MFGTLGLYIVCIGVFVLLAFAGLLMFIYREPKDRAKGADAEASKGEGEEETP